MVVNCGGGGASAALSSTGSANGNLTTGGTGAGTVPTVDRIWGTTIDDVSNLEDIVTSLRGLAQRPMTRLVFDPGVEPSDYVDAVSAIGNVSDIMGQPVDSEGLKSLSVADYRARMVRYFDAFGSKVKLWEVGNEVNGEWTGTTGDVVAKIQAAFEEAKARKLKTALTLYYNSTCVEDPMREMILWTANLPPAVVAGVDYVLISYYPDDCGGAPDWKTTFSKLNDLFPTAKVGFGELGTKDAAKKEAMIRQFYRMPAPAKNYVGGYFWWWFKQDAVPLTRPLWKVFRDSIPSSN